jgi:hypothetical protein
MYLVRRLEPVAPADGGDDEVQGGVLRVAALFDEVLRGLLRDADLNELLLGRVVLAEVGAQSALSVVNLEHDVALLSSCVLPLISPAAPRERITVHRRT